MGQMQIWSGWYNGATSTATIVWSDVNLRITDIIVNNNNESRNVMGRVYDETLTPMVEYVFAPGETTLNLPGSANRYVDIVEVAPGDYEFNLKGIGFAMLNPAPVGLTPGMQ